MRVITAASKGAVIGLSWKLRLLFKRFDSLSLRFGNLYLSKAADQKLRENRFESPCNFCRENWELSILWEVSVRTLDMLGSLGESIEGTWFFTDGLAERLFLPRNLIESSENIESSPYYERSLDSIANVGAFGESFGNSGEGVESSWYSRRNPENIDIFGGTIDSSRRGSKDATSPCYISEALWTVSGQIWKAPACCTRLTHTWTQPPAGLVRCWSFVCFYRSLLCTCFVFYMAVSDIQVDLTCPPSTWWQTNNDRFTINRHSTHVVRKENNNQ